MVRRATRVVLLLALAALPLALSACVAEPAYAPTYVAPYPYYGPYYAAPAPVYRPYSYYSFSYRSGPSYRYYHRHRDWRDDRWR